jgi:prolyl 4-hydroxylase
MAMDKRWRAWVDENIKRNCSMEDILRSLLAQKFLLEDIKKAMGSHFPASSPQLGDKALKPDYQALTRIRITELEGKDGVRRVDTPKVQLYGVDNFMSIEECDGLVEIINQHLRPSRLVASDSDKLYRTSSTCDLSLLKNPVVEALDRKIAAMVGINASYSEGIQAQKYLVGQEFKPHTDYFKEGSGYAEAMGQLGNRTWTFMVYLNNTPAGGGTRFPNVDFTFMPKKGSAVAWNNLLADGAPNRDTLHWGMPVEEGEKIIITKWFRERGMGNMFAAAA